MILLFILLTISIITLRLFIDSTLITKKHRINHPLHASIMGIVMLGNCLIVTTSFWHIPFLMFFQLSLFWLVFDYALNSIMGWRLNYIGKTAAIDRFIRKISNDKLDVAFVIYITIKIITFGSSCILWFFDDKIINTILSFF